MFGAVHKRGRYSVRASVSFASNCNFIKWCQVYIELAVKCIVLIVYIMNIQLTYDYDNKNWINSWKCQNFNEQHNLVQPIFISLGEIPVHGTSCITMKKMHKEKGIYIIYFVIIIPRPKL